MISPTMRLSAGLVSFGITLLSQLPVIPAALCGSEAAHPTAIQSLAVSTETSTIYDASENIWKRWSIDKRGDHRVVDLATSKDGVNWTREAKPAFEAANTTTAWDAGTISSPMVVMNESAIPERKYALYYCGSTADGAVNDHGANSSCGDPSAMRKTAIGLAFSADGRTFTRVSATESPCDKAGMILGEANALASATGAASGSVGEPRVTYSQGNYSISYFRVATDAKGLVQTAGLGSALSTDGIHWAVQENEPVTVQLVGHTTATPGLVQRLRQLVDAYSEVAL